MKRVLKMKVTKNIALSLVAAALFAVALPGQAAKDPIALNHCGCNSDNTGLEWTVITVSERACNKPNGHNNHNIDDVVDCDGTPFTRGGPDEVLETDALNTACETVVGNIESVSEYSTNSANGCEAD
jgi:hypothetical protein